MELLGGQVDIWDPLEVGDCVVGIEVGRGDAEIQFN